MKTIAVFYKAKIQENYLKPSKIAKVVCQRSTEAEYAKIRREYLENPEYSKALSFCWWLEDADADRILNRIIEREADRVGIDYETV